MMKAGAAESAPLLQKLDETYETPKPGAIAAAARQAKRGVGVFGVALALSGVLVAVMTAPDKTKKRAAASWEKKIFNSMRLKLPTGEVIMRGPSGALEPGKLLRQSVFPRIIFWGRSRPLWRRLAPSRNQHNLLLLDVSQRRARALQ